MKSSPNSTRALNSLRKENQALRKTQNKKLSDKLEEILNHFKIHMSQSLHNHLRAEESKTQTPQASTTQASLTQPPQSKTPNTKASTVPITLKNPADWTKTQNFLLKHNLTVTNTKKHNSGISFSPNSSNDHHQITRILKSNKIEYYTFTLQEDRKLSFIIKGLDSHMEIEEIHNEIEALGFNAEQTHFYRLGNYKKVFNMVKVLLPQSQANFQKVKHLLNLPVIKNCQKPIFHKCAEPHSYKECQKSGDRPAKCSNCGGPHPANYFPCPKNPNFTLQTEAKQKQTLFNKKVQPGTSFAAKTANFPNSATTPKPANPIQALKPTPVTTAVTETPTAPKSPPTPPT
ncbi:hypothetical protein D910_09051 [Dendroctonus ponderosae]